MYGNCAFVYFNTKESAMEAILKKDLMVTPQEKKKDLKVCFQLNAESTLFSRSINFITIIYIVPKKEYR